MLPLTLAGLPPLPPAPLFLILAVRLVLLLLLAPPVPAPPPVVFCELLADPLEASWLLLLSAYRWFRFSTSLLAELLDDTVLTELAPVLLMLAVPAAAIPVVRLSPNAVVAAARIKRAFMRNLLYLIIS